MPPELITLLASVLGSSLLGAFIGYFTVKKRMPNETRNSKADAAEKITNSAVVLTESMVKRFVLLEERTTSLEKHIKKQDEDISALRRHINIWVEWAEGIRINWPLLRLQEEAPELPEIKEIE